MCVWLMENFIVGMDRGWGSCSCVAIFLRTGGPQDMLKDYYVCSALGTLKFAFEVLQFCIVFGERYHVLWFKA